MAVVTFWSGNRKQSGQTLSMLAIATQMAAEHNMRCLVIDATFDDDTIERAYWIKGKKNVAQSLNKGKIDIASGAEGLVSAVASNKTSPEIIANFTKVIFRDRLDILLGLKTKVIQDHEKSLMLYKDLLLSANKYYDMVFVDLSKTLARETTKAILGCSNLIMYTFPQNMAQIEDYMKLLQTEPLLQKGNVLPVLSNAIDESKYNVKNVTKFIGERGKICFVPCHFQYMEAACEAGVGKFFLDCRTIPNKTHPNVAFAKTVDESCEKIISKLQEMQLKA